MAQIARSERLFRKAEAAMLAAVEIYNKPNFTYREETFAILMLNAWELLLKAKLLADDDNNLRCLRVYEPRTRRDGSSSRKLYVKKNRTGNVQTLGLGQCVTQLDKAQTSRLSPAVKANLDALTEIRDNAVHFVNASLQLAKQVLEIGTAAVRNFIELAKRWFKHDLSQYNLYLMPIGFISGPAVATGINLSSDEKKPISYLGRLITDPSITTATTGGFYVALELNMTFKRSPTDAAFAIAVTNDPSAPKVTLSEEDIRKRYPWAYRELTKRCKLRYAGFLENAAFHGMRRPLLADERFVKSRYLDPGNPKSARKDFYNPNILGEFDKHYTLK
jgi:hypothetical protein